MNVFEQHNELIGGNAQDVSNTCIWAIRAQLCMCISGVLKAYRDAASFISSSKDKHGRYRTENRILKGDGAFVEAQRTGQAYQVRLQPPPADLKCCYPPRSAQHTIIL